MSDKKQNPPFLLDKVKKFKTKTSLGNYVRYGLNYRYDIGQLIKRGDFFDLLVDLLSWHHDYKRLTEGGVDYFYITRCDINPRNRKFNVKTKTGVEDDFSYKKCIQNIKKGTFAEDCYKYYKKHKEITTSFQEFKATYRN